MEETVQIPIEYNGTEQTFEARVQVWQYGHRFFVAVGDVELTFEQDDSGDYRAMTPEGYTGKLPDKGLVQAIIDVLDGLR